MEIRYMKHYSSHLNRNMEFKVYGHRGKPVLFIPWQSGRCYDFENFHMSDVWAKWIEPGQVTVYAADCIDDETYACPGGDPRSRIEQHERWYHYMVDELVPTIRHLSGERNWQDIPIMTFGCHWGPSMQPTCFSAGRICLTASWPCPGCTTQGSTSAAM